MSRTIITKSDSEFFTNINSEEMLGYLCRDVGAKFYMYKYGKHESISLAYSMTKDEALFVSEKFRELSNKVDEKYLKKYKRFFEPGLNIDEFKDSLLYYAELFENSEGYECI